MNNLSSYCGLVDAKIRASDKDLPVIFSNFDLTEKNIIDFCTHKEIFFLFSGVMICSENYITFKNLGDQPDIRCPIPRRRNDLDDPDRGMIFVCSATHKTKSMFFFLVQTEQGDIFKIQLETDGDMVTEIKLKYFDTVPVATTMNVLKTGMYFVTLSIICSFDTYFIF